jgi:hypothetical protein
MSDPMKWKLEIEMPDWATMRREVVVDTEIAAAADAFAKAARHELWAVKSVERKSFRADEELTKATAARAEAGAWLNAANAKFTGWSRFFIVNNNGGHIHSTMGCTTCFPTTSFGWLPNLSGMAEADAVAEWGGILCSVCFPSAPSAWTDGVNKKTAAEKAWNKAMTAINRSPEGKRVKNIRTSIHSKGYNLSSWESDIARYAEEIERTGDELAVDLFVVKRAVDAEAKIAKANKAIVKLEAKLVVALAALDTALAG